MAFLRLFITGFLLVIPDAVIAVSNDGIGLLDESERRDLFLVDASSEGHAIDAAHYPGYVSDHNATCVVRIYGTPPHRAAGDKPLRKIAKTFKKIFNKVSKKLSPESPTPLRLTNVEVDEQKLGEAVNTTTGARRKLGLNWSFNSAHLRVNFICGDRCFSDDTDARYLLESHFNSRGARRLQEQDFANTVLEKLKTGERNYVTEAVAVGNCIRFKCDSSEWIETDGCAEIPIE